MLLIYLKLYFVSLVVTLILFIFAVSDHKLKKNDTINNSTD